MLTTRRTHRLPTFLLGCLTAALLTSQVVAVIPVTIDYTNGQTDATSYDTSGPNDPTALSILSGTATQSGILTGSGSVIMLDAGTLILSGANDYSGGTTLNAGTLQVVASGAISHSGSDITIGDQSGDVATLLISGGSVSNANGYLGNNAGSSGTATVSGGTWTNNSGLTVGSDGTGVLNLTDQGTVSVNSGKGTLFLANNSDSTGTLNFGTGGVAGTLNAASVSGGDGAAVVNFNHTGVNVFIPTLEGALTVNQIGPGVTILTATNTYTGSTNVLGGTLLLGFFPYPPYFSTILPGTTDLTLGSGTLHLGSYIGMAIPIGGTINNNPITVQTGNSFAPAFQSDSSITLTGPGGGSIYPSTAVQVVNSFSTAFQSAGSIVLDMNRALILGTLNSVGKLSAVNFNTAATGANGATLGSGDIVLNGLSAGNAIIAGFTVTDATGFGLATVDGLGEVIRLTTTALLPASGAEVSTDYRIDNNGGDNTTAGSSSLLVTSSQNVASITVDTTNASGVLSLGSGVVLGSDVWNFGGNGKNTFQITGSDSGAGITTATAGGTLVFNNYNASPVTLSTNILDNGISSVLFHGPGTTFLTGSNSYQGDTTVSSGLLVVEDTGSINNNKGSTTVGSQPGDNAVLNIFGLVQNGDGVIGDAAGSTGTVNVSGGGEWDQQKTLTVGNSGTGVLNIDNGYMQSDSGFLGVHAGSSGIVTVTNGGEWDVNNNLFIGQDGTGVLNLTNVGDVSMQENNGTVTLGAQGTLNIGTGGVAGALQTQTVTGVSGAVVNFNYNGLQKFKSPQLPVLTGDLAVNKLGGGYLSFSKQNSYTGGTTVNGGTLELYFGGKVTNNIISSASALTLGGGTLSLYAQLSGTATQTLNGLTTTAGTGSQIILSSKVTLNLGALTSAGQGSALNFDTSAGGANGTRVGTGIALLSGQTIGTAINPGFTVTDSTGFGLATVDPANRVVRLIGTDLLPASGALAGSDYRIDNNDGDNTTAGSSSLEITTSQTARSITVDTTNTNGLLTLDAGVVLSSDVWNFGSNNSSNSYAITGSDSGAGISTATAGGMLQINNYNANSTVTISSPILDNGGSGLQVVGTGTTILTGADTYTGATVINSGTLFINGDHTAATGAVTVQSAATLSGVGTLGSDIHVQNGGILAPGNFLGLGTLSGTTATFDTNSVFYVQGGNAFMTSLHLSGAVTITPGALIYVDTNDDLTLSKYTLMTAASGLDGSTPFTVVNFLGKKPPGNDVVLGYHLAYTGTELDLVLDAPTTAYWTGKVDNNWSSLSSGSTNWATAIDGLTDTSSLPASPTDVTFAAQSVPPNTIVSTYLDINLTINSLTINTPTVINGSQLILVPGPPPTPTTHTLTVNTTTTVNSLLSISNGATLIDNGTLTVGTEGNLSGNGAVQMASDQSIIVNGAITGPISTPLFPDAQSFSLTTSGTGAIVMEAGSTLHINLNTGAGLGDNTALSAAAGTLNLHGTLNATAGGTLVIENNNAMTGFAGGDQWKVVDLNSGAGTITGHLALNDSSLGLATGFIGSFDQTTGIYSIADHRPEMTAQTSGLPMANAEGQSLISGGQTATNDVNNHLFNLRSGGGEEDGPDGSIASSIDDGVVVGQGDGPEGKNPIAKLIKRTRQWEVFTTVNYGNVKLSPISNQSGVQVDSWASSVGIERHLSRGLTLGFAVTYLSSTQTYTGGLGRLNLEGPALSTYLAYVRKAFWSSLLYSFGDYDLDSTRNPGLGLPTASASTRSYTNAVQFNTGWNFRFQNNTFVTGPFTGIDYLHGTVDAYGETGGGTGALRYGRQTFQSLVTRVGWSASKKFETNWATITPQLRLSYERQNVRNNGTSVSLINAPFTATGGNQSPGQDYMVIGTGVSFIFTPEFNMQLGYQTQIFRNNLSAHFGSVRFGYKF